MTLTSSVFTELKYQVAMFGQFKTFLIGKGGLTQLEVGENTKVDTLAGKELYGYNI